MATEASTSAAGGSWVEGMSADNIKGLVLALSSSFFIGASFIVKKKGLKKAGASGVRAGDFLCLAPSIRIDPDIALLRRSWWLGCLLLRFRFDLRSAT
jgi:hypothetical protein